MGKKKLKQSQVLHVRPRKAGQSSLMGVNEDRPIKFAGRFYSVSTANVQVVALGLNPLYFDARCVTVSDAFQEYRFTKLVARAWLGNVVTSSPSVTPGGANLALAYEPGLLGSNPISVGECQNLQNLAIGNGTFGAAYPHLRLSGPALLGASPVKWFRRGTAYDDTLETQGVVFFASTDTFTARPLTWLIEYEVEFRAPADTVLTSELKADPTPQELQVQLEELQRVLGIGPRQRNVLKLPPPIKVEDEYVDAQTERDMGLHPARKVEEMKTADNVPLSARSRAGSVAMGPPRSAR